MRSRPRPLDVFGTDSPRRSVSVVLTSMIALGMILGAWHRQSERTRRPDPILSAVRTMLVPLQRGGSSMLAGILDWGDLLQAKALRAENARLATKIDVLERENMALRADAAEVVRLRAALNFAKDRTAPPLVAGVVGWLPQSSSQTITLDVGTQVAVRMDQVAVTPQGIVGRVITTDPFSSQVLLLSDVDSGVGALVLREGKSYATGIVRGQGRGESLELAYLRPEDDVRVGDRVVTSGYGGIFPPGLTIGTISVVRNDTAHFTKRARVQPAVAEPALLREVLLLRP